MLNEFYNTLEKNKRFVITPLQEEDAVSKEKEVVKAYLVKDTDGGSKTLSLFFSDNTSIENIKHVNRYHDGLVMLVTPNLVYRAERVE